MASLYPRAQTVDSRTRQPSTLDETVRLQLQLRDHASTSYPLPFHMHMCAHVHPTCVQQQTRKSCESRKEVTEFGILSSQGMVKPRRHQADRKDTDLEQGCCDGGNFYSQSVSVDLSPFHLLLHPLTPLAPFETQQSLYHMKYPIPVNTEHCIIIIRHQEKALFQFLSNKIRHLGGHTSIDV